MPSICLGKALNCGVLQHNRDILTALSANVSQAAAGWGSLGSPYSAAPRPPAARPAQRWPTAALGVQRRNCSSAPTPAASPLLRWVLAIATANYETHFPPEAFGKERHFLSTYGDIWFGTSNPDQYGTSGRRPIQTTCQIRFTKVQATGKRSKHARCVVQSILHKSERHSRIFPAQAGCRRLRLLKIFYFTRKAPTDVCSLLK